MRAVSAADLITELDATIARSSSERCARMLWRATELLVDRNNRLQEPHVGLLDDVLIRLARRIAPGTLAELSTTLAELGTAPMKTLRRLASCGDSTVNRFAIRRETANLFTALSVLSGAPIEAIEQVMAESGYEGPVMACRASRLNWQTTLAVLNTRGAGLSLGERARAQVLFETLHLSTSQWSVRWAAISAGAHGRTERLAGNP
ncbi:DUF2336 domain-containing protein [Bradyrhizobium sp. 145]|uniref:DUF2336 domain-containing protein n=1 Tax=Bradyrhizobium sp. 145 TaxID=2782621 RepID=UPI001FFA60F4|nr:DUF2336 domain-containing protein [Bradyrhizobium sp. 145]MCK1690459.1 DUF2336 domain-containing protein [Bradyrhizobium sp. 145]